MRTTRCIEYSIYSWWVPSHQQELTNYGIGFNVRYIRFFGIGLHITTHSNAEEVSATGIGYRGIVLIVLLILLLDLGGEDYLFSQGDRRHMATRQPNVLPQPLTVHISPI